MEREMWESIGKFENHVDNVMRVYDAAGMAVSVFDRNTVLYEKYFGYRNVEKRLPLDCDTIFGMASVSKSFTALAIMQLEDAGILSADDSVKRYIPEYEDSRVKISHLLTHSAGYFPLKRILIKDVAEKLGIYENGMKELGYDAALAAEGLKQVCSRLNTQGSRLGEPGRYMSYSNDGYGILSEIIHRVGGEPSFGEYVKNHIFEPLGMQRSSCEFLRPAKDANGTELYIHRGTKREHCRDFYDNAFVLMGGGAVKSTVHDMRRYVRMYLMNGKIPGSSGKQIVSRRKIEEMCKPRQEYHYGEWYGYGLAEKRIGGMTVWGHGGSLTGISNFMAWEPRLGIGVLVFCNTTGVPVARVAENAFCMAGGLSMEEKQFAPVTYWDDKQMKKAVGTYSSDEGVKVELKMTEGRMKLKVGDAPVPCRMIFPGILETMEPVGHDDLILMEGDEGEVFGIRFRGRILPRKGIEENQAEKGES